jgi:hypothetical protein
MKKLIDLKSPVDESFDSTWHSLSQHWLRYTALCVTAVLTGYAGYSYTGNIGFSIALVLLAEGASLFWAARINDFGNRVQQIASVVGTSLAWASIAATDLASVNLIAHGADLKVFTLFASVPTIAQATAVYVLPTLAVLQGILGTVHYFFSEEAAIARDLAKTMREVNKEISLANADARTKIAKAHATQYRARATAEAPLIGKAQGDAAWEGHVRIPSPVQTFAGETEAATLKSQEAAPTANPFGSNGKAAK